MNVNPEYIEEKRQETLIWKKEVAPKFKEGFEGMKKGCL